MSRSKRILIITCSGGNGLLQTANAKEQEIRESDPNAIVIKNDILKEWMGKFFGNFCSEFWNRPQRKGSVWLLQLTVNVFHPIFDWIFWPIVFLIAFKNFMKIKPDRVLDTQPLCTSAIVSALRWYNWKEQKSLNIEKILVDLPTTKATHFFRSIKKLSDKSRRLIRLVTIPPLLEEGETAQEFWVKNCRLSEDSIQYEEPFVRSAFRKVRGKPRSSEAISLMLRYKNSSELELMQKVYQLGSIEASVRGNEIWFKIEPEDKTITILLGSQPTGKAVLNYAKKFLELARNNQYLRTHLFLFRADHLKGERSWLQQIVDWVETVERYPKNFTMIPFGFQSDDVIAPLFHRSDITCTRSGGQTAMELLSVSTGEMWIHSETKGNVTLSDEQLLKGIPGWESASAVYLQKVRGAKLVTPDSFVPLAEQLFDTSSAIRRPNLAVR